MQLRLLKPSQLSACSVNPGQAMLNFLKLVGGTLLALAGIGLALGIGAALTALSAIIGTVMLGAAALLIIILVVREFLEGKP